MTLDEARKKLAIRFVPLPEKKVHVTASDVSGLLIVAAVFAATLELLVGIMGGPLAGLGATVAAAAAAARLNLL